MDVDKQINHLHKTIEQHLETLLPPTTKPYKILIEAARYSLLSGGKRLRPLLVLASADAFGAPIEKALSTACAIEMIHTYSLIHDDLPCMDDDDFRRGKPSLHKAYDEAHAVLAGDLLLTRAFEVIATDKHLTADQKVELASLVGRLAGGFGLIGGQSMDIQAEDRAVTLEELQEIHKLKTGALITASLLAGAIIGNASGQEKQAIEAFGNDLGLAFQIIDDVLDVTAGNAKRGSAEPSDLTNNKTTYVTLLGVEGAENAAAELLTSAEGHLLSIDLQEEMLLHLAKRLVARSY